MKNGIYELLYKLTGGVSARTHLFRDHSIYQIDSVHGILLRRCVNRLRTHWIAVVYWAENYWFCRFSMGDFDTGCICVCAWNCENPFHKVIISLLFITFYLFTSSIIMDKTYFHYFICAQIMYCKYSFWNMVTILYILIPSFHTELNICG